jgi:hypothetical protein
MDPNELPLDLHCPKRFQSLRYIRCKPCTYLASRLVLSPNGLKENFHLTNIPNNFHPMCLKRFPCPWNIRRKPCTYLAHRLTLLPNGPKQASTWHMSPRSTIRHALNDFHSCDTFDTYHASRLILSPNKPKWLSISPTSTTSSIGCAKNDCHAQGTISTNSAPILRWD